MQNPGLIEKIQSLPPETVNEVEDFVDFLAEKQKRSAKQKRYAELSAFAAEFGGTDLEIDAELENASAEYLLEITKDDETR
ncbi:DUF2281 domain-containing protein [Biomphalaria pfeifferi]|uniref:DUF2281 domain-containing protein n=1 Tax=Biomphalaria pfeifferi TaxID=112525 RepID=A0AAD8ANB0_BIOPF|nr:DUF2281 domain-containing protein [Biomphalaria pfeifferi]